MTAKDIMTISHSYIYFGEHGYPAATCKSAFMRTEQIMCLNRGRSKGEDCGHVKSI